MISDIIPQRDYHIKHHYIACSNNALFSCYINILMSVMRLLICFLTKCIPHLLHDVSISFDFSV